MEQIFMIEVFVEKVIFKIEPPQKDEYELKLQEEERKREAQALALLEANKKGKEKPKKKGKEPPVPTEEEINFLASSTIQMTCLPLFDFYVAHDNFIAIPPPPVGKKKKPKKPKKGKKIIVLPSEPCPVPPYFGVGNSIIFISRPPKLLEVLAKTPIYISVWNRDENMNCTGYCVTEWHKSFFECLERASSLNPLDTEIGEFRNTRKQEIVTNTVLLTKSLICEEDLKNSGEITFYVRLSCLGNRIVSFLTALPEMGKIPGRRYLKDDSKVIDVEVVRHWEGTTIEAVPPVAYFFGGSDIIKEPIKPEPESVVFKKFVLPFTKSELEILAMGFPKRLCGRDECIHRMERRESRYKFHGIGEGKNESEKSANKKAQGPCRMPHCPLHNTDSAFVCDKGTYKSCRKPCWKEPML